MNRTIAIIAGPTAVGKTEYALEVARQLNGEIVSADSMQIYQYMDIGSAKPTASELALVKHHLIGEIDPREPFSVAEYSQLARRYIGEILAAGKLPVVAGGTGLYVNALLYDMDFSQLPTQNSFRAEMERAAADYGKEYVHNQLRELDPQAAERIHPNNLKKVIRALEVVQSRGEGIKEFSQSFVKTADYDCVLIGLNREREELYQRIDQRVDLLMETGLLEEVQSLMARGLELQHISMKAIGYKELIAHLNGEYDLEEAKRLVKRNSRHYAKRQLTWFKRYADMTWFNLSQISRESAISQICQLIEAGRAE